MDVNSDRVRSGGPACAIVDCAPGVGEDVRVSGCILLPFEGCNVRENGAVTAWGGEVAALNHADHLLPIAVGRGDIGQVQSVKEAHHVAWGVQSFPGDAVKDALAGAIVHADTLGLDA